MTKLFLLVAMTSQFVFAMGQEKTSGNLLVKTSWKGVANIPNPENVIFTFNEKEMNMQYNGSVVEKMSYNLSDNQSVILKKIEGNSPCTSEQFGIYKYKIENDKLFLISIKEDCAARKNAFDPKGYDKLVGGK